MPGAEDLAALDPEALAALVEDVRARMRPLESQLNELRQERDLLLTEVRRRERMATVSRRAELRGRMKSGDLPTVADLVAGGDDGALDEFVYTLRTGGEVRLGFPGARRPTVAFTDGRQVAQAGDFAEAGRLYRAGWELGSPGRPGVRVHFPGTRQERLAPADDVFVRPRSD